MSGLLNRLTGHNTKEVAEAAGHTHTAKHEQVSSNNPGTTTTVTQTTTQPDMSSANQSYGTSQPSMSSTNQSYGNNATATNQHHGLGTGTQFYTNQPNVGHSAAATNTGLTGQSNAATGNRFVAPGDSSYSSTSTPATHQTGLNQVTSSTTQQQPIIHQQQHPVQPIMHQQPVQQQSFHQSNAHLNKVVEPVGQAALNKTVSVEHVQTNVPVKREVPVLQREPINESNRDAAFRGPAISEGHYETTLNQEKVQASKGTVPVERIHLGKQIETTMQPVQGEIRKEHTEYTSMPNTKIDSMGRSELNKTSSMIGQSGLTKNVDGNGISQTGMTGAPQSNIY